MRNLLKTFLLGALLQAPMLFAMPSDLRETTLPPLAEKNWIKNTIAYHYQLNTHDYNRYVAEQYQIQHDGATWNFHQWLHQMIELKKNAQSIEITFDEIIAEENKIATSYVIHVIKKDGSKLNIKVIALFTMKEGKLISCDELTHVIS